MKSEVFALLGAAALNMPCLACAQTANASRRGPDTSFSIGDDIVVTGDRGSILTSVDRIGATVAQDANVDYAWELVGKLPGVLLTEFNQGATSGKLSFRGFNGEGEVNAVKLLIDGVPSNSNDGNMPYLDMVFPLEIETVEVVRGTSDPRYGLHNIAGNVTITTRRGGSYLDARVSGGSFGKYDGQVAAGLERGAFTQNYAVGYRTVRGFRDHADTKRRGASARWAWSPTGAVSLGLNYRHYEADAAEPGYLTSTVAAATPRATNAYNATDGDSRTMDQASASAAWNVADKVLFSSIVYLNRLEDDRFVKFSAAAQQQRRFTDETHWGFANTVHVAPTISWLGRLAIDLGADHHGQDNASLRYLTIDRVPTTQTRDQAFTLSTTGAFVQAIIEPTSRIRITPAWRVDWVGGAFRNRLAGTTAPINDYGTIQQPKLSVAWLPNDALTLYGNWGRTFQIGVGSGAYLIPPRRTDLDPSINEGWEAGVRIAPAEGLEVRLAYWNQTATGEIKRKLNDPLGDFENIGATKRKGVDGQASWKPLDRLALWATISWQRSQITRPDPGTPQLRGNDIDHIPEWLGSFGADYRITGTLTCSLFGRAQSDYELTTTNNRGRYGDLALLNASVSYDLSQRLSAALEVQNLTDAYYEYVWWDGTQTLHSPGDGRAVIASLRARY